MSTRIQIVLTNHQGETFTRLRPPAQSSSAFGRTLLLAGLRASDDLGYAQRTVAPALARLYPDGLPDGTPWERATLRQVLEVAGGVLQGVLAGGLPAMESRFESLAGVKAKDAE